MQYRHPNVHYTHSLSPPSRCAHLSGGESEVLHHITADEDPRASEASFAVHRQGPLLRLYDVEELEHDF